jgi:large subunit ribosomal protein L18
MAKKARQDARRAIHSRIRKKVKGGEARPRLAVFRSINHIYAQVIDDAKGVTLCSASTVEKSAGVGNGGNVDAAKTVGRMIAERAKDKGIRQVVFDRGGYIYHGRVKALAEAAREAGLEF